MVQALKLGDRLTDMTTTQEVTAFTCTGQLLNFILRSKGLQNIIFLVLAV